MDAEVNGTEDGSSVSQVSGGSRHDDERCRTAVAMGGDSVLQAGVDGSGGVSSRDLEPWYGILQRQSHQDEAEFSRCKIRRGIFMGGSRGSLFIGNFRLPFC